jgi:SAM-dependent methyltransferase
MEPSHPLQAPSAQASQAPSPWVVRFAGRIAAGGRVLDVACGQGRHSLYLAGLGLRVAAVDRDPQAIAALTGVAGVQPTLADIEGGPWPYAGECFDAVVVTNYLHRPLLSVLRDSLLPAGVLIYETFAAGNQRYGRPSNPGFLLEPGELLELCRGLRVIAYEDLYVEHPRPALVQRVCAVRGGTPQGAA